MMHCDVRPSTMGKHRNAKGINICSVASAVETADDSESEPLFDTEDDADVDLARDIIWVYSNLENKSATPAKAPSHGAWSLLTWARKYRTQFFEKQLHRAIAKQNETDEKDSITHSKIPLDQCDKMLSEIVSKYRIACPECGCEYQHHVPEGSDSAA